MNLNRPRTGVASPDLAVTSNGFVVQSKSVVAEGDAQPVPDDLALQGSGTGLPVGEDSADDLSREVYCILGMPVDVIDMPSVLCRIDRAAITGSSLLLSTPNLNYLVASQSDTEFRDTLLASDLCPPDGMPIIWLGRLLGAPIRERVAGSDIFAALKSFRSPDRPLKLFLFAGNEAVACGLRRTTTTPKAASVVWAGTIQASVPSKNSVTTPPLTHSTGQGPIFWWSV